MLYPVLSISVTLALSHSLAAADEIWHAPRLGQIVYVEDIGTIAVLALTVADLRLYVEGLAGNPATTGRFEGVWLENTPGNCATTITAADGRQSNNWGPLVITLAPDGAARSLSGRIIACETAAEIRFVAAPHTPSLDEPREK